MVFPLMLDFAFPQYGGRFVYGGVPSGQRHHRSHLTTVCFYDDVLALCPADVADDVICGRALEKVVLCSADCNHRTFGKLVENLRPSVRLFVKRCGGAMAHLTGWKKLRIERQKLL